MFKGVHAQNYHIFTPPGEGRDWAMVWGCQPWIRELPYANYAYSYDFKEGESGRLVLEFWITPFDYAPYDGPVRAVESKLEENKIIGLSWSILDYDEKNGTIHLVGKKFKSCFCPLVKGRSTLKSGTFCMCSQGWMKEVFETVSGKKVNVELEKTILRGSDCCAFKMTLT